MKLDKYLDEIAFEVDDAGYEPISPHSVVEAVERKLRADGWRIVKLEHCQDQAKGYTVNYGAWNILDELA